MRIPVSENLRSMNWSQIQSSGDRLANLQSYEQTLASMEGRPPCQLNFIEESDRKMDAAGQPLLLGQFTHDQNTGSPVILFDRSLLEQSQPYEVMDTYFHEARHAYQAAAAEKPEIHSDPREAEDWAKNFSAYSDPENVVFSQYRWQPVEDDANETARQRLDQLYENEFQDEDYRRNIVPEMDARLNDEQFRAEIELGEDYRQTARQNVLNDYTERQSLQAAGGVSPLQGSPASDIEVEDGPAANEQPETAAEQAAYQGAEAAQSLTGETQVEWNQSGQPGESPAPETGSAEQQARVGQNLPAAGQEPERAISSKESHEIENLESNERDREALISEKPSRSFDEGQEGQEGRMEGEDREQGYEYGMYL